MLTMRALIPAVHALGWPWLYLRYTMPALPLLVVAAVAVARDLAWETRHFVVIGAVAVALGLWLHNSPGDMPVLNRIFILRITLAAAVASVVLVVLAKRTSVALGRWPRVAAGAAFAFSLAITTGIDLWDSCAVRTGNDRGLDEIAAITPARFALVGRAGIQPDLDIAVALRATRDVEAADLMESDDWVDFRRLIDRWADDNRPIYLLGPDSIFKSPWPDVVFEPLNEQKTIHLVRRIR
jgi:hypothetical protein